MTHKSKQRTLRRKIKMPMRKVLLNKVKKFTKHILNKKKSKSMNK